MHLSTKKTSLLFRNFSGSNRISEFSQHNHFRITRLPYRQVNISILLICWSRFSPSNTYRTTIAVLLGEPSPALFTAMMRYSSSFPFGCSTNVASVITAVATSSQLPLFSRSYFSFVDKLPLLYWPACSHVR